MSTESDLSDFILLAIAENFDRWIPHVDQEIVSKNIAAAQLTSQGIDEKLSEAIANKPTSDEQKWWNVVVATTDAIVKSQTDSWFGLASIPTLMR
jgi:hypothetical protein